MRSVPRRPVPRLVAARSLGTGRVLRPHFQRLQQGVRIRFRERRPQISIQKSAFSNTGTSVPAAFLGGKAFRPAEGGSLRTHFVNWLIAKDNPYFAHAFSNRAWFYFFARGIVNPIDDLRESNRVWLLLVVKKNQSSEADTV
jgi:Protein of unknown function (DUF1553)